MIRINVLKLGNWVLSAPLWVKGCYSPEGAGFPSFLVYDSLRLESALNTQKPSEHLRTYHIFLLSSWRNCRFLSPVPIYSFLCVSIHLLIGKNYRSDMLIFHSSQWFIYSLWIDLLERWWFDAKESICYCSVYKIAWKLCY